MSLQILPYAQEAVPAVREFNQRLLAGGALADQQFPETPDPGWMPGMELFLAVEESMVRGGYILRRQTFSVAGATLPAAHYRLPLSEGIINRSYAMLGLRMVRDALSRGAGYLARGRTPGLSRRQARRHRLLLPPRPESSAVAGQEPPSRAHHRRARAAATACGPRPAADEH